MSNTASSSTPSAAAAGDNAAVPLATLGVGQKGRVAGYDAGIIAASQAARLSEMGLTKGTEVEVVRFAPLGDPIDIKVRGYHLSLRKREAAGIRIALPAK